MSCNAGQVEGRVAVRPMRVADVDAVMALAASLETAPVWGRRVYEAAIDAEATPPRIALVAELGGDVAGFIVAAVIAPQAEIESIAVAVGMQRRGVARALTQALVAELKRREVAEILLELRASNAGAAGFYRGMGFSETGRRRGYYAHPDEDAILMTLGTG